MRPLQDRILQVSANATDENALGYKDWKERVLATRSSEYVLRRVAFFEHAVFRQWHQHNHHNASSDATDPPAGEDSAIIQREAC